MLPPGALGHRAVVASLTPKGAAASVETMPPSQQPVLAYLQQHPQTPQPTLKRVLGGGAEQLLVKLERAGLLERQATWRRPAQGERYVAFLRTPPGVDAGTVAVLAKGRAKRQAALLETVLTAGPPIRATEARRRFGTHAVAGLLSKGLVVEDRVVDHGAPNLDAGAAPEPPPPLTGHQQRALAQLEAADGVATGPAANISAARGHGKRQDGGLPASAGNGAGPREAGHHPRAGDIANASDAGPVQPALSRTGGGAAQRVDPRRSGGRRGGVCIEEKPTWWWGRGAPCLLPSRTRASLCWTRSTSGPTSKGRRRRGTTPGSRLWSLPG